MVRKLIFALGWVGIFIISLGGIYLGVIPEYFYNVDFYSYAFRGSLIGLSAIYLLLAIEKFLSNFEKPKDYEIQTENGKLTVSSSSVNNLVKEIVGSSSDIKNIRPSNKIKRKKLFITVKVDAYTDSEISKNILDLQRQIKDYVFEYLGVEVENVEVKVSKLVKRKAASGFRSERGDE
ncbi:alkaline shock response membrane anchor protein AmaP [uncultured Ilyobacter sp.]|uniref:alkaline shock response membrane anchor protein AmaP n=1 Tax=uncultured Ilyobacter sp. TaxID=544433 RepID=UPI0029C7D84D|nr:alkaline shock response membrane anchor protein AmaP [uncultured Ilyobacter sp.]